MALFKPLSAYCVQFWPKLHQ